MGEIKVSDGARKLREHIDSIEWTDADGVSHRGMNIPQFCEHIRVTKGLALDRIAIKRVLDGERGQRVTVDFAMLMSAATNGEAAIELWASDTLRAAES